MKYTTYKDTRWKKFISAAEKLSSLGQKDLAKRFTEHANDIISLQLNVFDFDILVGVKPFMGAKFFETRVLREKESNTIMFIFKSGSNTHRINTTLKESGEIVWHDGNLFSNRKSVRYFENLIRIVVDYNRDIQKLLSVMGLHNTQLRLIHRTFYI